MTSTKGTGNTFTYADPATGTNTTATYKSTDVFTVDGVTATIGAFGSNLSAGDIVTILANTPTTGVTTYQLVNVAQGTILSGLVGAVNTGAGTTFDIIEPVTGTVLRTIDYTGTNTVYTVNGAAAALAVFESNINEGDTVVITGKDTLASPWTIALTNTTVTGKASSIVVANPTTFKIDTAAGATLGDNPVNTATTGYSVTAAADTFTVDGVAATFTAFGTALTAGDTISYSRAADVQTVALTNTVAAPVTGIVQENSNLGALNLFVGTATTPTGFAVTGYTLKVNGVVASSADFTDALTAGDSVTVQVPDGTVITTGTASLTDNSLSGDLSGVVVGTPTTVDVLSAGGGALYTGLNVADFGFYAGNTSATYFVGGVSQTLAQFNTELSKVQSGAKDGTIQVVDNGLVTEFRITTVANTASATLASVVNPGHVAVTNLDVTFTKPVYEGPAWNAADFTIVGSSTGAVADTAVTPSTVGTISSTVHLAIGSTTFVATENLTVTLSATGAAKLLDANGTAATAGAKTIVVG